MARWRRSGRGGLRESALDPRERPGEVLSLVLDHPRTERGVGFQVAVRIDQHLVHLRRQALEDMGDHGPTQERHQALVRTAESSRTAAREHEPGHGGFFLFSSTSCLRNAGACPAPRSAPVIIRPARAPSTLACGMRAGASSRRGWRPEKRSTHYNTYKGGALRMAGFLDKERTIAGPGFNRWLVPPAALCIHLCIGMAYGFSVFWLPLTKALGRHQADRMSGGHASGTRCCSPRRATGTSRSWAGCTRCSSSSSGSSAALWGGWLERAGPRKAGVVSALCWCGGLVISAVGVLHPPALADVARLRRHRRHRPGAGLHLARCRR